MNVDDLIEHLQQVKSEYGNIPLYHWEYNNDGSYIDIMDYNGINLSVKKIFNLEYEQKYYDYDVDDEVCDIVTEICEAELDGKLPNDAKNIHIGAVL